jgi:hypothetical protein
MVAADTDFLKGITGLFPDSDVGGGSKLSYFSGTPFVVLLLLVVQDLDKQRVSLAVNFRYLRQNIHQVGYPPWITTDQRASWISYSVPWFRILNFQLSWADRPP